LDAFAADPAALPPEMPGHGAATVERGLQLLLVD
jgi:hypothetical protein